MEPPAVPHTGGRKGPPPLSIQCPNCSHWKHPRAAKCKEDCGCECVTYQHGVKKKRQRAAIEAADGEWRPAMHRKVIHQVRAYHLDGRSRSAWLSTEHEARFAAECMQKSKAVYAVWVAHHNPVTNTVTTDLWGSAPWVEKELGGKAGICEIIWKAKAMQHLTSRTVDGLGEYGPVFAALKRYELTHLEGKFRENKVDVVAFRVITDAMLASMGVNEIGDRIKLLEAARELREAWAAGGGGAGGAGGGGGGLAAHPAVGPYGAAGPTGLGLPGDGGGGLAGMMVPVGFGLHAGGARHPGSSRRA